MNRKVLILSFAVSAMLLAGTARAEDTGLLRDGSIISGADGKMSSEKNGELWFFEFSSDANDNSGRVSAGSKLELLPSAALEKIEDNMAKHSSDTYRLWARVTRYGGKNYLFVIYFLPLTAAAPATAAANPKISINEPNDALALPEEVIAKLKTKKIVHPEELEKAAELKEDSILADRIGFIVKSKTGSSAFVLDGLGQNCGQLSLELLPCEMLEHVQGKQAGELDKTRLRAAGIVTRYKGRHYMLLQRAVRVYSYGNFE